MDENKQYAANTEEPAGFENFYPVDATDTGNVEFFATGAGLGDAGGENPGGLSDHSLEADSISQPGYDRTYGEMTGP
ncbi:hypothetical protein [Gloeobacter morelensis]|uniref:hypothetical protein n=1 Tax=Gloeobacter morelensis TaxID=2907343 RepID=UPI001E4BA983|nr:hypothetical protein [Gloeobacter morelensis]